jgi:hypothetical protein
MTHTKDEAQPAPVPDWKDGFMEQQAETILWQAKRIAELLDQQAAQPEQGPVAWAKFLHYPECWDTAAYPTLHDAIHEALAWAGCSVCTPPAAQRTWVGLCAEWANDELKEKNA